MTCSDEKPIAIPPAKSRKPGGAKGSKTEAALDQTLQAHIGRQLRAMYDEVIQEPVPDRFLQLLEGLESKTAGDQ